MKTITVRIDDEVLSRAERKAAAQETSVSEVVVEYLRHWADRGEVKQARAVMAERFAKREPQFTVGTPDDREQRNARA